MALRRNMRLVLTGTAVALVYFLSQAFTSASSAADIEGLRLQAMQLEQQFAWDRACDIYEEILRLNRNLPDVRQSYRHCLRRANQVYRHQDATYRKDVLGLKYELAVRLYETVFLHLLDNSLEKRKVEPGRLFRKGLEEFSCALADPFFCQQHLRGKTPNDTLEFREYLRKKFGEPVTLTRTDAFELVREVALKAKKALELNATATVMEFTCGACYALDDYTMYLSPGQLRVLSDTLKGEIVGVGIWVEQRDGRLVIAEVLANSPASEEVLAPGDAILAIDKKPTANMTAEVAQELLEGEVGTAVELFIASSRMEMTRSLALKRRPVFVRSVSEPKLNTGAIGYLHISTFQETTVGELDNALLELSKADIKALILDLRGNSGGLMDVAIEVAERFLTKGKFIVSTQHYEPKLNAVYHARNDPAFALPLIVLVDADTASAAEVLAGALKDNGRAQLVGQTTFGKGCSQEVVRLPSQGLLKSPPHTGGPATGGLRITVARFYAQNGQPYSGRGVTPHRLVEQIESEDIQLEEAGLEAQRQLGMLR